MNFFVSLPCLLTFWILVWHFVETFCCLVFPFKFLPLKYQETVTSQLNIIFGRKTAIYKLHERIRQRLAATQPTHSMFLLNCRQLSHIYKGFVLYYTCTHNWASYGMRRAFVLNVSIFTHVWQLIAILLSTANSFFTLSTQHLNVNHEWDICRLSWWGLLKFVQYEIIMLCALYNTSQFF